MLLRNKNNNLVVIEHLSKQDEIYKICDIFKDISELNNKPRGPFGSFELFWCNYEVGSTKKNDSSAPNLHKQSEPVKH